MKILLLILCPLFLLTITNQSGLADDIQTNGKVCGSPSVACQSKDWDFKPHDLSFRLPAKLKWLNNYYSAPFYAIILKSRRVVEGDVNVDCSGYFSETERQQAQKLFRLNKVFASRFACGNPGVSYTNVNWDYNILAVYAGETKNQADEFLRKVIATNRYPDVRISRMQVILDYGD